MFATSARVTASARRSPMAGITSRRRRSSYVFQERSRPFALTMKRSTMSATVEASLAVRTSEMGSPPSCTCLRSPRAFSRAAESDQAG